MSKVRINDLARELEVKSKAILDVLTVVGVTEKKTHSSSLESDEAERVRLALTRGSSRGGGAARHEQENRMKIDLSRVSRPGDALRADSAAAGAASWARGCSSRAARGAQQHAALEPRGRCAAPARPGAPLYARCRLRPW